MGVSFVVLFVSRCDTKRNNYIANEIRRQKSVYKIKSEANMSESKYLQPVM